MNGRRTARTGMNAWQMRLPGINAGGNCRWRGDYCSADRSLLWTLMVVERWLGRFHNPRRMAAPQARGRIECIQDKMAWSIWSHPRSDASDMAPLSTAPRADAVIQAWVALNARVFAGVECMRRGASGRARIASTPKAQVMMNLISVQVMRLSRFRRGALKMHPTAACGKATQAC